MLIELRLLYGKRKIKRTAHELASLARVRAVKVHHLSVYGDFHCKPGSLTKIADLIQTTARDYDRLSFLIDGVRVMRHHDGRGNFAYFNIVPSSELIEFRERLCQGMQPISYSKNTWDRPGREFLWHMSIALHAPYSALARMVPGLQANRPPSLIERLVSFLTGKKQPIASSGDTGKGSLYLPLDGLRITVLNDRRKIMFEYDLPTKRILQRASALDRTMRRSTLQAYRMKAGLEHPPQSSSGRPRTYLISDLHLDHANIIGYCARPFANAHEMNRVMIDNWNRTVRPQDTIYFLGDMAFGRGSKPPQHYLSQLNGHITFIRGNHDKGFKGAKESEVLNHNGMKFLLIHDPADAPSNWGGWVIHGHTHNADLRNHPFINGEKKTINVGVELVNYRPIELETLLAMGIGTIRRADTINTRPERF